MPGQGIKIQHAELCGKKKKKRLNRSHEKDTELYSPVACVHSHCSIGWLIPAHQHPFF